MTDFYTFAKDHSACAQLLDLICMEKSNFGNDKVLYLPETDIHNFAYALEIAPDDVYRCIETLDTYGLIQAYDEDDGGISVDCTIAGMEMFMDALNQRIAVTAYIEQNGEFRARLFEAESAQTD